MDIHAELEARLAKFKGADASLVYQSGYAANVGLIPQLVGKEDLIVSDELDHGSIIDGVRLSHAERAVYKHNDTADLQRVLEESEKHDPPYRRILVITDGVFSMDGDIAPLDVIAKLASEHGAMVYVDDAHGEGVLGEGGRGVVSHFKLDRKMVQVEMGTFSKAFGVVGGHISGSRDLVDFAENKSRSFLLSGSHPPAVVAACTAAIDTLEREPEHVKRLWDSTKVLQELDQGPGVRHREERDAHRPHHSGRERHGEQAQSEALRGGRVRSSNCLSHGREGQSQDTDHHERRAGPRRPRLCDSRHR